MAKVAIRLGNEVEDGISKLRGTATNITYYMSGTVQVGIHPPGDGKTVGKGHMFDVDFVEFMSDGLSCVEPDDTSHLVLGTTVRDVASGFTGVMTSKTVFVNGCTHVGILPPVDASGKLAEAVFFDWKRIETVDGVVQQVVAPKVMAPVSTYAPTTPPPGGPSMEADLVRTA